MTTPQRGLPGWAIGLIVGISALLLLLLVGGFVGLRLISGALSDALSSSPHVSSAPTAPGTPRDPSDTDPGADATERTAAAQATRDAEYVIGMYDQYLAASRDGSIRELVPDGANVDPDYFAAFLYMLTDLRSAARFVPPSAENAEQLHEYAEQAEEYERLFLAGKDLDVDIKITREDGSVFETDGKYRTVTP